eukprot:scaffold103013_cov36-Phaeocystis_antarctica.AAC.1
MLPHYYYYYYYYYLVDGEHVATGEDGLDAWSGLGAGPGPGLRLGSGPGPGLRLGSGPGSGFGSGLGLGFHDWGQGLGVGFHDGGPRPSVASAVAIAGGQSRSPPG